MSLKPRKVNFNHVWNGIEDTLKNVMCLNKISKHIWNDRFLDIYIMCTAIPDPLCDELYQATKVFLENHTTSLKNMLLLDESILLQIYYKHWCDYSRGASYLNLLYGYLNSQYIKKQKYKETDLKYGRLFVDLQPSENTPGTGNCPPHILVEIGDLALSTWKNQVLQPLAPTLRKLLLSAIYRERQKSFDIIADNNLTMLSNIIQSFVEVDKNTKQARKLYETEFEVAFLEDTSEYYRNYSNNLLNGDNKLLCSQYMHKIVDKLSEEGKRNKILVDSTTLPKAELVCQKRLITDPLPFLHSEANEMIKSEQFIDLNLMYTILLPIENGLTVLIESLGSHITELFMAKIQELEKNNDPATYVESILTVHDKYQNIIATTFYRDTKFLGALDRACAEAINYKPQTQSYCRAPEQLSRYCDMLLKKSLKLTCESDIENKLSKVVILFTYLRDKDTFQQFYANMLAKRLIYGTSQSLDLEENMINKLKSACGYDFTNKLYRMFTDIRLSKDQNDGFTNYLSKNETEPILPNFTVFILQAGAWPINQTNLPSFQTPQILEKCLTQFEQYYNSSFNGRKLMWLFHLSVGEIKLNYLPKPYFISLNTFQMAILLLFNTDDHTCAFHLTNSTTIITTCNNEELPSTSKSYEKTNYSPSTKPLTTTKTTLNLNYDTIQHETGLADSELKKHLFALTNFQILRMFRIDLQTNELQNLDFKFPINPHNFQSTVATSTQALEKLLVDMEKCVFTVNTKFQNKKTKLKLTIPSLPLALLAQPLSVGGEDGGISDDPTTPSTSKSNNNLYAVIEEDRKLYLQAVIVRIMKSRKNINHNHLIQEVIDQSKSRFSPSVNVIKKCIETLMDKQYLRRNPELPEEYIYMA